MNEKRGRQTPADIIGPVWMDEFVNHYRKTYKCETKEDFDKAVKKISAEVRKKVGQIYKDLREYGFYPDDLDKHGNIKWQCRQYDRYDHIPVSERYAKMAKSPRVLEILTRGLFKDV